jgi:broad specificity phosphatase PhoE
MIEIVYETHSITTDNEAGIATGWLPGALSEAGRAAARQLGERRRDDGIELVFTSDLLRAVETARIAFAGSGLPLRQDVRLRECNYGRLNGRPVAEIDAERLRRIDRPFPDGESYRDVVERTRSFLADLAHDGAPRVLLIAHSANRWALEHLIEGTPLDALVGAPFAWREGWLYQFDRERFREG